MQKLRSYLPLLIIGFFLFGCISKTSEGYFDPVQNLSEWIPLGLVAIVISFMLAGITYMIAELVKMPELNAWAKNEIYESMISTFFLGSIIALMIFLNVFITAVSLSTEDATGPLGVPIVENGHKLLPPHIEIGEAYLEEVDARILDTYISLVIADQYIDALGTLTLSAPFDPVRVGLRANVGLTPAAGLSMISNTLITITDTLAIMDVMLIAQTTLLRFIEETMFSIFLPLGIVLRAFPITRRLGSTLIALAITLYVVYPLTLGINHAVITAVPGYQRFERLQTQGFQQIVTPNDFRITNPQDEVVFDGNEASIAWQILGMPTVDSCSAVIKESGTNVPLDQSDCINNKHILIKSTGPLTLGTTETHKVYTFEVTVEGKDLNGNPLPPIKDEAKVIVLPNCMERKIFNWHKCWYLSIFGSSYGRSFGGDTTRDLYVRLVTQPIADTLNGDPSGFLYLVAPPFYNQVIFDWLVSVLPTFGQMAAAVTLFTVIDIIICVTFFRSLSSSIGGEAQLLGLARVI